MAVGPRATPATRLRTELVVDHLGKVVHDLDREVASWRERGFAVSDPAPLRDGEGRELGQSSAHVVFDNGYVELSCPKPGSGNHLEPYLKQGEGARILVLGTHSIDEAQAKIAHHLSFRPEVREAARQVAIGAETSKAMFRWFPLPVDVIPGVLSAVVEHRNRDLVLDPRLIVHANGLRTITAFVARGRAGDLHSLPPLARPNTGVPLELEVSAEELAVRALVLRQHGGREEQFML